MNTILLKIVKYFEEDAANALSAFKEKTRIGNILEWRSSGLYRRGFLDGYPVIDYKFHGNGIFLCIEGKEIDFNFGYFGISGGFDSFNLLEYIDKNHKELKKDIDIDYLDFYIQEAIDDDEIGKYLTAFQDDLLYRKEYLDNELVKLNIKL